MPEKPFASTLARSAIIARTAGTGSGSPTPAAWLRSRFSCSARELVVRDRDLGERAEAGVDAVDRRVAGRVPRRRPRARRATRAARVAARAPTGARVVARSRRVSVERERRSVED